MADPKLDELYKREQRIAELKASISAQIAELYELVDPTMDEVISYADMVMDDRKSTAEDAAEDRMGQIEHALWMRDPENWDEQTQCGCCGSELDDAFGKSIGCLTEGCTKAFCSGECYDKHVAKSGHDS